MSGECTFEKIVDRAKRVKERESEATGDSFVSGDVQQPASAIISTQRVDTNTHD